MIFKPPITTPRLYLKEQSLHDFERFYAMSIDPEVMKYIGDGSVFHWTRDVAMAKFKQQIDCQGADGLGTLAVYRRRHPRYLGWCTVAPSRFLNAIELGYRFCRDAWGRGYATEAAAAMLFQVFGANDLDQVQACVHPDNQASIRVLEKLGFRCTHAKLSKPIQREIPIYTLWRKAFLPFEKPTID